MFRPIEFCVIAALAVLLTNPATEAQIASEDFDGGAVNLISGFDPANNVYGPLPTMYGIFELNDFTATMQGSFSLVDDSVADVSGGGVFPNDFEGIYGMNRAGDDAFFCAVSTGDVAFPVSWVFDVSSAAGEPLTLSIDMGQMSNDGFGGVFPSNFVTFEYSFDGGAFNEAMALLPVELVDHPSGFQWRNMDDGDNAGIDFDGDLTHRGLEVTTAGVTKTLADTGAADNNTILNKTPPIDAGAGQLDNYSVPLEGKGSMLELRLTCDFDFEAFSFDNIRITTGTNVLKGDVNLDGVVDLLDVVPFVAVLQNGLYQAEADTNCDGSVNLLDVEPFVILLGGG